MNEIGLAAQDLKARLIHLVEEDTQAFNSILVAKQDKIILLQGRLDKEEEAELIKATMEEINKEFKGIELAVMDSLDNGALTGFDRLKGGVANMLLGNRGGLTLVGPANVVKKVKKNPKKLQFMIEESKKRTRKKRR